jgi:hypothetical protein
MKTLLLHGLLLALLLVGIDSQGPQRPPPPVPSSTSIFSPRHPILVTNLLPGSRIEIDLLTHGCFDLFQAHLQLVGDRTAGIKLAGTVTRPGHLPWTVPARYLSQAETTGLDLTLALYRSRTDEGTCTSQTDIRLVLYDGAVVQAIEQYHDATCSSDGLQGLVYFESLAASAFPWELDP